MKRVYQGAEARLYEDKGTIVKERFRKEYRIEEIDNKLRKSRTKREAKVLKKLESAGFSAPRLVRADDFSIVMERIDGEMLKDVLNKDNFRVLSRVIGEKAAELHNLSIIHGDLTTSNMIYCKGVFIIDFGLSFFSHKIEDKAVDLHLLKQALESKHHEIWEDSFREVLKGYRKAERYSDILNRLEAVEKRGRYKKK